MAHQRPQHAIGQNTEGYQLNGNDVVMVVKDRMTKLEVSQIILMVPAADLGRLHGLPLQPQGTHLRRPAADRDRKRVHDVALTVHHVGAISRKACDYLSHWAQGIRRRLPRPAYYNFLAHQVQGASALNPVPLDLEEQRHDPRLVVVAALGGHHHFLMEVEPDDGREPGLLVIALS